MDERKGGAATKEGREKKEGEGEKEEGEGEKEKGAGEKEEKDEKKQGAGVVRPCSSICIIGLTQMPTAHVHAHTLIHTPIHTYAHKLLFILHLWARNRPDPRHLATSASANISVIVSATL